MIKQENPTLPYLSQEERLQAYQTIIDGCQHLWSKNQLQRDKTIEALVPLIKLGQVDPYFLAHLTSWAAKHPSRDLQVTTVFANSLSTADGRPFRAGSKYNKPNLRYVSAAALCQMEPKLVLRIKRLGQIKFEVKDLLNKGSHCPNCLMTAIKKYLKYREANIEIMKGIKKAGLSNTVQNLYRSVHLSPSDEAASILRWQQKDKKIEFAKPLFDFKDLSDLEIAKKIREEKIPVLGAIGALPHISPVIAVALLEQATGNQAVILRKTFEDSGVLQDKEVMKLYGEKIKEAKTSIDRVETISRKASESVKKVLKEARAEVRKEEMKDLGKIYLHLDASGSMSSYFDEATKLAAILSECVDNPKDNFRWGLFGSSGEELALPQEFVQDAFKQVLFGRDATAGSTNVFALYDTARKFGAIYDCIITDQGHNVGNLTNKIREYHQKYPEIEKPKACLIVDVVNDEDTVKKAYEENGIPVSVIRPETLTGSALVAQSLKQAIEGPMIAIDAIMSTKLLKLPAWYLSI